MVFLGILATAFFAYLFGSIPTGFLVAKARGLDIRTVGSGNIGATNVLRSLGKPAGIIVLLVDAAKGWSAVQVGTHVLLGWFASANSGPDVHDWFGLTAALCAVLGHNYTCWLWFKGGKGIATSAGVLLALVPSSLLIILGVWVVVFAATRYVSLASVCASFMLPFAAWLTGESRTVVIVTALMAALAIYKHKSNIQRLVRGTENRIGGQKHPPLQTPTTSK